MDERLERVYARWCARSVLHLWDAPEVVRRWVDEGEEGLREEALRDAAYAAEAAWAAYDAAAGAAGDAGDAAAEAAWAAYDAAAEAAWAAGDAAAEAAGAATEAKQQRTRDLLGILPDLLRTHGLAARLLDEVREDPWLTREVVRALGLPDLAVWVDWCKQMETT